MPTYDYKCDACGHAFEKFQPMSAAPIRKCPACGKSKAKRLIGIGAGVIFKGGGFYETDYRSDSYNADAKKDSGDTGKADGKTDGKTDAKPDSGDKKGQAKTEPKPDTKAATSGESKPAKSEPAAKSTADMKKSA